MTFLVTCAMLSLMRETLTIREAAFIMRCAHHHIYRIGHKNHLLVGEPMGYRIDAERFYLHLAEREAQAAARLAKLLPLRPPTAA